MALCEFLVNHCIATSFLLTRYVHKAGEIDILEGVHDNEHNQITWHTKPGNFPRSLRLLFPLNFVEKGAP
jgi:hypothetical protein